MTPVTLERFPSGRTPCGGLWVAAFLVVPLFMIAGTATAQVEDFITINTLAAGEAGGCYPGTAGADATMFVRYETGLEGCDTADPFDDFCLARRDLPSDGPNGVSVSFGDMALLRPAVAGDGSFTLFVRNLDLCLMSTTVSQQDICYNLPGPNGFFVHGIGVQPQGSLLGLIPRDLNNINVPANAIQLFALGAFPTVQLLSTFQFTNPLIFPETVDLMTRGEWLVFDASTTSGTGGAWGLYLVNGNTGELRVLAPAIPGYELRNPVFGQTSDDVIAFEAVSTTSAQSTVLTANLRTGAVERVAEVALTSAVPTYNGDDSKIIFNREDAGVTSGASLRERAIAADRITAIGSEQPHLSNGGFATIYRRGTFDDSAVACPEPAMTVGLSVSLLLLGKLGAQRSRRACSARSS